MPFIEDSTLKKIEEIPSVLPSQQTQQTTQTQQSLLQKIGGGVGNIIKETVVEPLAKGTATGLSAGRGLFNLGQAGVASLQGNKQEAQRQLEQAKQPVSVLGYEPIAEGKTKTSEQIREAVGTGAKVASLATGSPWLAGASYGFGEAVESGAGPVETVGQTITGGIMGKVGGAVIGKGLEKLSVLSPKIATLMEKTPILKGVREKFYKNAEEAITVKTTELGGKAYGEAAISGEFKPSGLFSKAKNVLSQDLKETAKEFASLLQSKNALTNAQKVKAVVNKTDDAVGKYLEKQNRVVSPTRLKSYLADKMKGIGEGTTPDLAKYKNQMIDNFVNGVKNKGGMLDKIFKERKLFDQGKTTYLDPFSGNPTLKKDIAKVFRNGVQDFIKEEIPDGVYKNAMSIESRLLRLIDEDGPLFQKVVAEKGKSGLMIFLKDHPTIMSTIKYGLAGVVLKKAFNIESNATPGTIIGE